MFPRPSTKLPSLLPVGGSARRTLLHRSGFAPGYPGVFFAKLVLYKSCNLLAKLHDVDVVGVKTVRVFMVAVEKYLLNIFFANHCCLTDGCF